MNSVKGSLARQSVFGLFTAVLVGGSLPAQAATDLSIASSPLELRQSVEPNLMILADDSGSMGWSLMTSQSEGTYYHYYSRGGNSYYRRYVYSVENGRYSASVVPPEHYSSFSDNGFWRATNSDYNKVYYNPTIRYQPWAGVDSDGNAYTDATPSAARLNPYDSSEGTYNLTASHSTWFYYKGAWYSVSNYYAPFYYTWTDSDADGVVDSGEKGTKVEIKSGSTYSGGANRTDCADSSACTYDEEIQNFANWYSYYRTRLHVTKAALSFAIEVTDAARLGYSTIWERNKLAIASMNSSTETGAKRSLLNTLYSSSADNGTPLRTALKKAGEMYSCTPGSSSISNSFDGTWDCPVLTAANGGNCQQNYAMLITDGFWNQSSPSLGDTDGDNDTDYDGQNFAATEKNTLADVAMHYYERDLQTGLTDDVLVTPRDRLLASTLANADTMHQHMTTYTVGFGVKGTIAAMPDDTSTSITWPNPTSADAHKVDDLMHAAYNGRGEYLDASDTTSMISAISEIFNQIGEDSGTGSAVSFSTQELETETRIFQAFYNSKFNSGDLVALAVASDGTPGDQIWSAASVLDNMTWSDRKLVTWDGSAGTALVYSSSAGSWNDPDSDGVLYLSEDEVNYLRGDRSAETRDSNPLRERATNGGRLGDIVHSSPQFVGEPYYSRRDIEPYPTAVDDKYSAFKTANESRQSMVIAGANDGFLHIFNAVDGTELMAYMPSFVLSDIDEYTDLNYRHRYYVDLTPAVNDVFIKPTSAATAPSWQTVMVGGGGAGGRGYFALNITDPNAFATVSGAAGTLMWEFTDADDSDLGYAMTVPTLVMTNAEDADGNKRWAAVFGNGYNSDAGDAKLFVAFLDGGLDGTWTEGTDYIKLSAGSAGSSKNGLGIPRAIDIDEDGTVDYVYAGDLDGKLYRFDLTSTSAGSWSTGDLLFTAASNQPITTQPLVVAHPDGSRASRTNVLSDVIVLTTTGSWMTSSDASNQDLQSIYGVWDTFANNWEVDTSMLVEQTLTNVIDPTYGKVRTLTNNAIAWSTQNNKEVAGWKINLDVPAATATGTNPPAEYPGERAVRRMLLRGSYVFVNTVYPNDGECDPSQGGFAMAFSPYNGGIDGTTIFDFNNDGSFDSSDNNANGNVYVGWEMEGTPNDGSFLGSRYYTPDQEGNLEQRDTNTDLGVGAGRLSWREL